MSSQKFEVKQFYNEMEKLIHEDLLFSNLNNIQLDNKEIADKVNFIFNIIKNMPSNIQETSLLLLSSYFSDENKNIFNLNIDNENELKVKIAHEKFTQLIMESKIGEKFVSDFKISNGILLNLSSNLPKLKNKEGLNVPMYLIDKFANIEQMSFFLISYLFIDPDFISYSIQEEGKLFGYSFISYTTKLFLDFFTNQTNLNIENIDLESSKYITCLIFSLINLNKLPNKNVILNQIIENDCTLLDIYDKIILELYIKLCENGIDINKNDAIFHLARVRYLLTGYGSTNSKYFAEIWTSALNIRSNSIPFPRKEYFIYHQMPSVLESFYENEKEFVASKSSDSALEYGTNFYNIIFKASFDSLPKNSQNIYRMVKLLLENMIDNDNLKNVPYFLTQLNTDFLYDCKISMTEEFLDKHNLKSLFKQIKKVELIRFDYSKKEAIKNSVYNYVYSKKTIKEFAYEYFMKISSMIELKNNFINIDGNTNEFDYYVNNFDDISINLPDLKIAGFTIPMFLVKNRVNNLSSFLAAYDQLDPNFVIKKYSRSGELYGFSILSFVLHYFLSDIDKINNNHLINYIESIDVILTSLENQPEKERGDIFDVNLVDNVEMFDRIIDTLNEHKDQYEKNFIDKKIDDLNYFKRRFLKISS